MKKAEECINMNEIREAINSIDEDVVRLVAKRAAYVKAAAQFKKDETAVRDKERVENVITSKRRLAVQNDVSPELIEKIYRTMIDFFISEEMKEWKSKIITS